ncbi:MAG: hydantoinase/oxoprolinase family protein [Caldilineaceae bacterium]
MAAIGMPNLITFDIGGTTCDVSLIQAGKPLLVRDRLVEGYPVLAPFIDIHSIGAGGGTILWADPSDMLRVGPQSAGAEPGPACYGRGGQEPTITDAYVVLGLIDPAAFLGGKMPLDPDRARRAIEPLARRVGMSIEGCARGALTILDHAMVAALRVVSIERGHDPRDFTLMAFGGAGSLHIGSLARELGIRQGLVPRYPSLFSAWGILAADIRHSYTRTLNRMTAEVTAADLDGLLTELQSEGQAQLQRDQIPPTAMRYVTTVDMRYAGQEHSVNVACPMPFEPVAMTTLIERFHQAHEQAYTYRLPNDPVTITNVRLDAVGVQATPQLAPWSVQGTTDDALIGRRQVYFEANQDAIATPIYARTQLGRDSQLAGPCIIEEATSTTVILPGQSLRVDGYGNLICETQ